MLLCCDAICLVKRMEKQLRVQRSLSAKRVLSKKQMTRGGYTQIVGDPSANVAYDVIQPRLRSSASMKTTRKYIVSQSHGTGLRRKKHCPVHQPALDYRGTADIRQDQGTAVVDAYERLLGSPAYIPANRHSKGEVEKRLSSVEKSYSTSQAFYDRKVAGQELKYSLRHRGD